MRYLIGVDIGGTNGVVGIVAEDGSALCGVRAEPTRPEEGPERVVERVGWLLDESASEASRVAGVARERSSVPPSSQPR